MSAHDGQEAANGRDWDADRDANALRDGADGGWTASRRPGAVNAALKGLAELCDRLEEWADAGGCGGAGGAGRVRCGDVDDIGRCSQKPGRFFRVQAQAYGQAATLAPGEPMLRRNYAETLIKLGRLGKATFQLDLAERVEPDSVFQALRSAELAKAHGDGVEARRWAEETLRRQPGCRRR